MKLSFGDFLFKLWWIYGKTKIFLRTKLYGFLFLEFGKSSKIYGPIFAHGHRNIIIGEHCTINEGVILNARYGKLRVGNYVRISSYVIINTPGGDLNKHYDERLHIGKDIVIEDGVWIGSGAIINPGVKLGKGCVVGAGAVVTKEVTPFTLVAGVPAIKLKNLSRS